VEGPFQDGAGVGVVGQRQLGPVGAAGVHAHRSVVAKVVDEGVAAVEFEHHRVLAKLVFDLAQRALQDHVALGHEADVVAQLLDLLHAVGGKQDGSVVAPQLQDDVAQEVGVDGVEAAKGLVEDEERRVVQQGRNELHLLLHAFGQLLGLEVGPAGGVEPVEPVIGARRGVGLREPLQGAQVHQLLFDAQALVEAPFLGEVAHALLAPGAHRPAVVVDRARVRHHDVGNHADRGGFSRPVGAQQPQDATGMRLKRDVINRCGVVVALGDVIDTQVSHRGDVGE